MAVSMIDRQTFYRINVVALALSSYAARCTMLGAPMQLACARVI